MGNLETRVKGWLKPKSFRVLIIGGRCVWVGVGVRVGVWVSACVRACTRLLQADLCREFLPPFCRSLP